MSFCSLAPRGSQQVSGRMHTFIFQLLKNTDIVWDSPPWDRFHSKVLLFGLSLTPRIFRRCMQGIHSLLKKSVIGKIGSCGTPWGNRPPMTQPASKLAVLSLTVTWKHSDFDPVLETMGRVLPRTNYLLQEGCFLLGRSTNRMINTKVRALLWNTESFRLLFNDGNF